MRLLAIARDIATLSIGNALARIKAIIWVIFHSRLIYAKRKAVQKYRKVGDSYIFRVFTEKYLFRKKVLI